MKRSLVILCLLPFLLLGVDHALAQSASPSPVARAATSTESDKAAYIKFKAAELAHWQKKVSDFNARAETSATQAGRAASLELAAAWSDVEASSTALSAAGAEDWDRAKTTYESAKRALEVKWAKIEATKT